MVEREIVWLTCCAFEALQAHFRSRCYTTPCVGVVDALRHWRPGVSSSSCDARGDLHHGPMLMHSDVPAVGSAVEPSMLMHRDRLQWRCSVQAGGDVVVMLIKQSMVLIHEDIAVSGTVYGGIYVSFVGHSK